jgi:ketosteroid isomerase-like protein
MAETKSADKTQMLQVVTDFFKQFKRWFGLSAVAPDAHELEKYLSTDMEMFENGRLVVSGGARYLDRLQKFQKKYRQFDISDPLEEPIAMGNRVALYYRIDITTHDGKHKQAYLMGLFTIKEGKISHWIEVTNEHGAMAY